MSGATTDAGPRVRVRPLRDARVTITEKVAKSLEAIANAHHGTLTPDYVLAAARNRRSPLHDRFTWDDSEAAEKYRLVEARDLIRSVTISFVEEEISFKLPAYLRDPRVPLNEQGYVSIRAARTSREVSRDVVLLELKRARSALVRAEAVASYLGVTREIKRLIATTDAVWAKID